MAEDPRQSLAQAVQNWQALTTALKAAAADPVETPPNVFPLHPLPPYVPPERPGG